MAHSAYPPLGIVHFDASEQWMLGRPNRGDQQQMDTRRLLTTGRGGRGGLGRREETTADDGSASAMRTAMGRPQKQQQPSLDLRKCGRMLEGKIDGKNVALALGQFRITELLTKISHPRFGQKF